MMNQNVCRCCLKEDSKQTINIFGDGSSFLEDLKLYLPACLKFDYNDGLPQIICDTCCLQVQQIKNFQQQCLIADQELRRRYSDYKNQAVEEVLGLIEKLRQEDHVNDLHGVNKVKEMQHISDNLEFSQLKSDLDLYNFSHDSEIYNDSITPAEKNYKIFLQSDKVETQSFSVSRVTRKSIEFEIRSGKKSYKSPFFCNHCDKKFTRNFQLKLHLISIHQIGDGLQYTCKFCSKNFASNHSLSYHKKSVHYQEKTHFCHQCGRQFVLKSQLVSHMRTHTGDAKPRIFECHECGKKWPTKSDLRTHMRSHDPNMERPFKCDCCKKSFFTRGHLTSHQLVHTGEKPFVCKFCQRSYQSVGNLNNHVARRHVNNMLLCEQSPCDTLVAMDV